MLASCAKVPKPVKALSHLKSVWFSWSDLKTRTVNSVQKVKALLETPEGEEARQKIARRDAGRRAAWAVGNGAAMQAKADNANNRAKSLDAELKACLYERQPTFAAIAKCLNAKGVTAARGKEFAPMTVKRMMERLGLTLPVTPPEQQ